jgi:hypothetical protein
MICVPPSPAGKTVKNEALGCCRDTTRIGLFYHFRMKLSSGKNAFFEGLFEGFWVILPLVFHSQLKMWLYESSHMVKIGALFGKDWFQSYFQIRENADFGEY